MTSAWSGVKLGHAVPGLGGATTWLDCVMLATWMRVLDEQWGHCFWGFQACLPDGSLALNGIAAGLQDAYHLFLEAAPRPGLYRAFEGDREHGGLKGRCLAYEQALADVEKIQEFVARAFHDWELLADLLPAQKLAVA